MFAVLVACFAAASAAAAASSAAFAAAHNAMASLVAFVKSSTEGGAGAIGGVLVEAGCPPSTPAFGIGGGGGLYAGIEETGIRDDTLSGFSWVAVPVCGFVLRGGMGGGGPRPGFAADDVAETGGGLDGSKLSAPVACVRRTLYHAYA
jgi:opacity protein-like surface antigen